MNVAILFNEPTLPTEHPDYASESGVLESVQAFHTSLTAVGHRCEAVGVFGTAMQLWDKLGAIRADVIVNLCEGFGGKSRHEPHVAACLELLKIPYTGSPPDCLALVHDKARTKRLLQAGGLPTAAFFYAAPGDNLPHESLAIALRDGPFFVKPAAEDASLGISGNSVVHDLTAVQKQVAKLQSRYGPVLIEQYLAGREFNVGVIAVPNLEILPLAEIEFHTDANHPWPIVTYESKWATESIADRATPVRCPANVELILADRLRQLARAAFTITGCRHYARVDFRTDARGEPFILEVNANPDLGPSAGFARAIRSHGWTYADFVSCLVATTKG